MFKKAVKNKSKLRLAVFGPSGSGKTYSALRIAQGLGKKVAVVDTEKGSASKYADRFEFDVLELINPTIDNYVNAIAAAKDYDVLIVDSLTHAWQELLIEIDKIAKTKYSGNSWSAWSDGTPKQKKLINSILLSNCHIIATMRSKTEWAASVDNNGKMRPQRIGLAPEQGKGIEYEFDMLMELTNEHVANIIKDRTGKYQDKIIEMPGEELGKELREWLNDGAELTVSKEAETLIQDIYACENINALKAVWEDQIKKKWNSKELTLIQKAKDSQKETINQREKETNGSLNEQDGQLSL